MFQGGFKFTYVTKTIYLVVNLEIFRCCSWLTNKVLERPKAENWSISTWQPPSLPRSASKIFPNRPIIYWMQCVPLETLKPSKSTTSSCVYNTIYTPFLVTMALLACMPHYSVLIKVFFMHLSMYYPTTPICAIGERIWPSKYQTPHT